VPPFPDSYTSSPVYVHDPADDMPPEPVVPPFPDSYTSSPVYVHDPADDMPPEPAVPPPHKLFSYRGPPVFENEWGDVFTTTSETNLLQPHQVPYRTAPVYEYEDGDDELAVLYDQDDDSWGQTFSNPLHQEEGASLGETWGNPLHEGGGSGGDAFGDAYFPVLNVFDDDEELAMPPRQLSRASTHVIADEGAKIRLYHTLARGSQGTRLVLSDIKAGLSDETFVNLLRSSVVFSGDPDVDAATVMDHFTATRRPKARRSSMQDNTLEVAVSLNEFLQGTSQGSIASAEEWHDASRGRKATHLVKDESAKIHLYHELAKGSDGTNLTCSDIKSALASGNEALTHLVEGLGMLSGDHDVDAAAVLAHFLEDIHGDSHHRVDHSTINLNAFLRGTADIGLLGSAEEDEVVEERAMRAATHVVKDDTLKMKLFQEMIIDTGSTFLTVESIKHALSKPEFLSILEELPIEMSGDADVDAVTVMAEFDKDDNGKISLNEFLQGC